MTPPSAGAPGAFWRSRTNRAAVAAKVALSAALLYWLLGKTDWTQAQARIAEASWLWLCVGFLCKTVTVPLVSERWRLVAAAVGARFSALTALQVIMIGQFFGQVLPGAVGADAVRGWMTWRLGHSPSAVVTALVVDRLAALLAVALVFLAGLPHLLGAAPPGVAWFAAAAAAASLGGVFVLLRLEQATEKFPPLRRIVAGFLDATDSFRTALTPRLATTALIQGMGAHLSAVATAAAYAHALNLPISLLDCLAVIPLSIVVVALPVSLAGWGVREGSLAAGFALFGVPTADSVTLSLMIGLTILAVSLPGAAVWLMWRPGRSGSGANIGNRE